MTGATAAPSDQKRRFCIFCASSDDPSGVHTAAVVELAHVLVSRGIGVIYGGVNRGLMRTLADTVLAAGGECIGVISRDLVERKLDHGQLTQQIVTDSLSARKARMLALSDAVIAAPGGIGTLDELFEVWTAAQFGFHHKQIGLLNSSGYFDDLLRFLDRAVATGFVAPSHRSLIHVADAASHLVGRLLDESPGQITRESW